MRSQPAAAPLCESVDRGVERKGEIFWAGGGHTFSRGGGEEEVFPAEGETRCKPICLGQIILSQGANSSPIVR